MDLPDFILPPNGISKDHLAFFVTTAGEGIREQAEVLKEKGEYLRSHVIQALALETAEAAAEWIRARLRAMWCSPDDANGGVAKPGDNIYLGAVLDNYL